MCRLQVGFDRMNVTLAQSSFSRCVGMCLLLFAIYTIPPEDSVAQQVQYSFSARNAPLSEALKRFSKETEIALTYLSDHINTHSVTCVLEQATSEDILTCLLQDTGLGFHRLSTGTYAIVKASAKTMSALLHGKVVSSVTQRPIAQAHVLIHNTEYGTTSDHSGRFVLQPLLPGRYKVSASHLGYVVWSDSILVVPHSRHSIVIYLDPAIQILQPIIIDEASQTTSLSSLFYEQVDAASLIALAPTTTGLANTLQSLQRKQGIQFDQTTSDIHIQGGATGEHQVRVDGSPIFLPQQLGGFWGPFSPQAIERITIHKSGYGARLGSFQTGIIDLSHRLTLPEGKHVAIELSPLSLNTMASMDRRFSSNTNIRAMAALRTDLWSINAPDAIQNGLTEWSAIDNFPLVAPLFLANVLGPEENTIYSGFSVQPDIKLDFEDVHTAVQLQFSPAQRIYASGYWGSLGLDNNTISTDLSIDESYHWLNATGQVTFDSAIGTRMLASLQARSSSFRLRHDYQLVDQLDVYNGKNLADSQRLIERPIRDMIRTYESALSMNITYVPSSMRDIDSGAEYVVSRSRVNLVASHTLSLVENVLADGDDSLEGRIRLLKDSIRLSRFVWYIDDTWRFNEFISMHSGVRWTWVGQTSYLEPRLAFSFSGPRSSEVVWGGRIATGLYRQYITQHDLSTANLGAILPSLRIWLPLGKNGSPPRSIHAALNSFVVMPGGWTVRTEQYWRYQPHTLVLNQQSNSKFGIVPSAEENHANFFLESARSTTFGLAAVIEKSFKRLDGLLSIDWHQVKRRSPSSFSNRTLSPPWLHPVQAQLSLSWQVSPSFMAHGAWSASWGRAWGFRQVYYDNLAHNVNSSIFPPYDLSEPDVHQLPFYSQVDLGLLYKVGRTIPLRVSAGALNVLNTNNVADWRLSFNDQSRQFEIVSRRAVPRLTPYVRVSTRL